MKIAHICFLDSSTGPELTTVFLICFTNTYKVTYDFIQSPRLSRWWSPHTESPSHWGLLKLEHPDSYPSWLSLAPAVWPDTGQYRALSHTRQTAKAEQSVREMGQRLVSENVKEKKRKKKHPTYRGTYLVQYSNYRSHRHTIHSFTPT